MSGKNLHIFNDQLGFFTNKTVRFIEEIHIPNKNVYLNIAGNCKNQIELISYRSVKDFLKPHHEAPEKVFFHSYNYANQAHLKMIKNTFPDHQIQFIWIFWSHEFYQLPEFFKTLYQGFSRQFYLRKVISFHYEHFRLFLKGESHTPFYLGLNRFRESFKNFSAMAALIKDDYVQAMKGIQGVDYQFVSYISTGDFPDMDPGLHKNRNEIMIGHSGSPIVNHYEILEYLSKINYPHSIFVPLSYGKAAYISKLKSASSQFHHLNITFQTDYMNKDDYYRKIENVGYFILNSYCQQALGNIFFFLWTGAKVFLRKNTSSYLTLKERGFYVYNIDEELTSENLSPLTPEQKRHNHQLVLEMIGPDPVKKSWLNLLNL